MKQREKIKDETEVKQIKGRKFLCMYIRGTYIHTYIYPDRCLCIGDLTLYTGEGLSSIVYFKHVNTRT